MMIISSGRFGGSAPAPTPTQISVAPAGSLEVDTLEGQYMMPLDGAIDDQ